jgi:xanthine dehydrogenase accessory factor
VIWTSKILRKAVELLDEGETFALATVIGAEGATPRSMGSKMIITKAGKTYGSIGGGRVERLVVSEALQALQEEKSRVMNYVLEKEDEGGIGMPCGGKMEVFVDCIQPKPTLLIIGGGHISASLARLGCMIDFSVIVLDPLAKREDFPDECQVVSESVNEGLSGIRITSQTFVVVATRHEHDEEALRGVIKSNAAYIGLVGSKKRAGIVFQALKDRGVAEDRIRSVYSPIGLNIDAETPEEIAISIIAEIIKVLREVQVSRYLRRGGEING